MLNNEEIDKAISNILNETKQSIMKIIEKVEKQQEPKELKLTSTESAAAAIILNELNNDEGFISIVKLIEKSSISRPVFTNTLQKLKDSNIAIVENKGTKGTYVKIKNIDLLKTKI